jgi:hypothetical protein
VTRLSHDSIGRDTIDESLLAACVALMPILVETRHGNEFAVGAHYGGQGAPKNRSDLCGITRPNPTMTEGSEWETRARDTRHRCTR